ncbi:plant seed peroxygenase [Trifolium repens]|nr:plant seed peroxygenase [Trifolium repens]
MSSSPNSSAQSKNIEEGFVGGVEEKKPIPVLNENVLQKHAAFFDLNQDGVIYPWETYQVKNIQLGKHGSDTGVYDSEGRFVASKFEEIFIKHAHTHPNALTYDELKQLIKSNREPKDLKGRIGSSVEWNVLYKLAKDKNGLLQKETIRGVYDGSLFEVLKKEHTKRINSS